MRMDADCAHGELIRVVGTVQPHDERAPDYRRVGTQGLRANVPAHGLQEKDHSKKDTLCLALPGGGAFMEHAVLRVRVADVTALEVRPAVIG